MNLKLATALVATAFASTVMAQSESNPVTLHGSIQSDIVVPENDSKIGTEPTSDDVLTNT